MKRVLILAGAVLMIATGLRAQNYTGGYMVGVADFLPTDALSLSRENGGFTTARVSAMGGAFTSLGGDMASIGINPAGLGMFRHSAFSVSMLGSRENSKNNFANTSGDGPRLSLNNIGLALNTFQGAGSLVSMTFAFSYNKLADYRYNSNFSLGSNFNSISELYANQLYGIYQRALGSSADAFNNLDINVNEWGGVLAYQTELVNPENDKEDCFTYLANIGDDAMNDSRLKVDSRGYTGEYSFAMGMNISNLLYLGATLGIQDINSSKDLYYTEDYYNNSTDLSGMSLNQYVDMRGTGVNFKIGATLRPVDGLRIGVAFHTPTAVSVKHEYGVNMKTYFSDGTNVARPANGGSVRNIYDYEYSSPAKVLLGISYTIGNVVALSVDYDRVWYDGIRLRMDNSSYNASFKQQVKENFKAANNFRFGAEVKPLPQFALRCGYALYGSPLKKDDLIFDSPVAKQMQNISFGVGFRFRGGSSIDLAYVNSQTAYSDYNTFYYKGPTNHSDETVVYQSPLVKDVKHTRGTVSCSFTAPF